MSDFWWGVLVGVLGAGILGRFLQWFSHSLAQWQDMDKPQKIVLTTKKTPWEVVLAGLKAGLKLLVAIGVIGALVYVLLRSG